MDTNPVIEMMGRRLRLAVIGGGPGSFIGPMHRTAARVDDRYDLVAAALSSDPERSRVAGRPEGFHEAFATIYSDAAEAIAARRSGTTSIRWRSGSPTQRMACSGFGSSMPPWRRVCPTVLGQAYRRTHAATQ